MRKQSIFRTFITLMKSDRIGLKYRYITLFGYGMLMSIVETDKQKPLEVVSTTAGTFILLTSMLCILLGEWLTVKRVDELLKQIEMKYIALGGLTVLFSQFALYFIPLFYDLEELHTKTSLGISLTLYILIRTVILFVATAREELAKEKKDAE